jgi:hypothetical protein
MMNDDMVDSNIATLTINITPVNDTAVAMIDAYTMDEDNNVLIAVRGVLTNDTDADGDTVTAVLDTNVSHGILTLDAGGSFICIPVANFYGIDTFTYLSNDGTVN